MEALFTGRMKMGEIVIQFPKASQILDKFHIDFCNDVNRPIKEALLENNLNEQEVLSTINQLYMESRQHKIKENDIATYSATKLIHYIVENHHSYLYKALPELSRLIAKVLRIHGSKHRELEQVYHLFNDLKIEIEQHIIQEEDVVFPLIAEYEKKPTIKQLMRLKDIFSTLEDDHRTNTEILSTIREVTNNYQVPGDSTCLNYRLTFVKLQELEADLKEHMQIENDILLPRFESLII